jgi:hypothetical protein
MHLSSAALLAQCQCQGACSNTDFMSGMRTSLLIATCSLLADSIASQVWVAPSQKANGCSDSRHAPGGIMTSGLVFTSCTRLRRHVRSGVSATCPVATGWCGVVADVSMTRMLKLRWSTSGPRIVAAGTFFELAAVVSRTSACGSCCVGVNIFVTTVRAEPFLILVCFFQPKPPRRPFSFNSRVGCAVPRRHLRGITRGLYVGDV